MLPTDLAKHLPEADALIIVPPFAGIDRPSLGAHVLQACAREKGFEVRILYANLLLAAKIGELDYEAICFASTSNLLGERYFAHAAYDVSPGVYRGDRKKSDRPLRNPQNHVPPVGWEKFAEWASAAGDWAQALAEKLTQCRFPVIGCTSTFEQTAASISLLKRIKALRPDIITVMGGANCEGPMAKGVRSLTSDLDYVFSGESEVNFPEFLAQVKAGKRPDEHVFYGSPCHDLDKLPTPDFTEYYAQLADFLPDSEISKSGNMWLPYESSRGCWWGEKHHCTFCGINGGGMVFRQKSPDRVISELQQLCRQHPTNKVCMVDNIMPHTYFDSLLPRLAEELPDLHMFYEQKANLTIERVALLKSSGVQVIQPGIEALSTPLLRLMKKGVSAAQNIALLRYARIVDLAVNWNLLYAFPGDRLEWYASTAELMPLLRHLNPPTGLCHLSIDRFSPYFERPHEYQITNLQAMPPYFDVLPDQVDHHQIAYHFEGAYSSESREHPEFMKEIEKAIEEWREVWKPTDKALPVLEVAPLSNDLFLVADSRGLPDSPEFEFVNLARASIALVGPTILSGPEEADWALKRKVCVELDGNIVPLATAPAGVLHSLEEAVRVVRRTMSLPVLTNAYVSATV